MPTLPFKISKAEIEKLSYERYAYPQPVVQKRIFAVYLKMEFNYTNRSIGLITGLHYNMVAFWINVYKEKGFDGLLSNNYGTNKSRLEDHAENILDSFLQRSPINAAEAMQRISEMTGISRSEQQVRAFMKRHGLKFIKCGHIPAKADNEAQHQWVETELKPVIAAAQQGQVHLLFCDAAHFVLQPFICSLWCAFRVSIALILDNARYQHCFVVKTMAKSLGIHLLFLPPYSPNLNVIERLWKFTKKKILYAKYYNNPKQFHEAIQDFFNGINKGFQEELKSLLTLKFQFFDNKKSLIYPL